MIPLDHRLAGRERTPLHLRLAARARELRITHAALALQCGVSTTTVGDYLRGDRPGLGVDTLARLCLALGLRLTAADTATLPLASLGQGDFSQEII